MLSSKIAKTSANDTLKALFVAHIEDEDCESLATKTALIQRFQHELEELECNSENQTTHLYAISIFSGFSGCLSLAGMSLLNPLLAVAVGFTAVSSAATVIASACLHNQKLATTIPKLKRYALALDSSTSKDWGTLWHLAGCELFLEALVSASKGNINHKGELLRNDGRNPLAVAVDFCAERLGISRTELLERAKASTSTQLQDSTPPQLQASIPTKLQDTAQAPAKDYEQNAISIIDNLVLSADKQTLGGLVIIAAPGSGKTTFLGTAWGRLKNHHSNRLNTLAVVVKRTDLSFFKAYANKAYCVKDSPINIAIEIIKFIDTGMKPGKITRVFLDDFLTMNVILENALKGIYIEPNSYCIQDKKELGFVPLFGHFVATLNEAWLVGREYNLSLWASTHSSNITDLPWCTSASVRTLGTFIFLAKNGNREFLELALNNNFLISDNNKRPILKKQLDSLDAGDSPIVLSNSNNWELGLVPKFVSDEYQGYRNSVNVEAEALENEENSSARANDNNAREKLELFFKLPSANAPTLSKLATTILDIIRNGNPPTKLESIRKSRKWGDKAPAMTEIKSSVDELISKELVEGSSEDGYTVVE